MYVAFERFDYHSDADGFPVVVMVLTLPDQLLLYIHLNLSEKWTSESRFGSAPFKKLFKCCYKSLLYQIEKQKWIIAQKSSTKILLIEKYRNLI